MAAGGSELWVPAGYSKLARISTSTGSLSVLRPVVGALSNGDCVVVDDLRVFVGSGGSRGVGGSVATFDRASGSLLHVNGPKVPGAGSKPMGSITALSKVANRVFALDATRNRLVQIDADTGVVLREIRARTSGVDRPVGMVAFGPSRSGHWIQGALRSPFSTPLLARVYER